MSAFPNSPTNGQQATVNGVVYTYSSALTAWTVTSSGGSIISATSVVATGNIDANAFNATSILSTGNVTAGNVLASGDMYINNIPVLNEDQTVAYIFAF